MTARTRRFLWIAAEASLPECERTRMNDPHIGRVVVDEAELQQRIRDLGKEITNDYVEDPPLLVGILKGAFMFMADLARAIDLPVEFDFMAVSSYGSATRTSGVVRIVKDLDLDLTDRHVLIVEDIVDSGLTLAYLRKNLKARNPASLEVCALLVKEGLQKTDPDLKYTGFRIPPDFVIGYGLDVVGAVPEPALHRRVRGAGPELLSPSGVRPKGRRARPRPDPADIDPNRVPAGVPAGVEVSKRVRNLLVALVAVIGDRRARLRPAAVLVRERPGVARADGVPRESRRRPRPVA